MNGERENQLIEILRPDESGLRMTSYQSIQRRCEGRYRTPGQETAFHTESTGYLLRVPAT